ncbi:DedA family protein [Salinicoccus roseus]|uniref:DedA family protein n=1 Tax=Salinicoccus roseus TaxID=45670 RepID=UPI0023017478|nr:DedA family protein [Salinicoccus roseus]
MESWLIEIINEFGYIGILLLIAFENVFPPIPSEIILTFGGFITTTSDLSITGVAISSTIGSLMGAIILYMIGSQLAISKWEKIIDRWGHIIRLKTKDLYTAQGWFDKYGYWAVFICRFIPLIRSLISIPAGMSQMNLLVFICLTTLGTLIWNFVLVYLGASVGTSWEVITDYMEVYSYIIYTILLLLIIFTVIILIKRKRDLN